MRLTIHPGDRVHMLVWRVHRSEPGDPGWRVAQAVNGIPLTFGTRFMTWREAIDAALDNQERQAS